MKTNKLYKLIVPLLFLAGSIGVAWGQENSGDAVSTGSDVTLSDTDRKINFISVTGTEGIGKTEDNTYDQSINSVWDGKNDTWWKAAQPGTAHLLLELPCDASINKIYIQRGAEENERSSTIKVEYGDNSDSFNEENTKTFEDIDTNPGSNANASKPLLITLAKPIKNVRYIKVTFVVNEGESKTIAADEIAVYGELNLDKYSNISITHKESGGVWYEDSYQDNHVRGESSSTEDWLKDTFDEKGDTLLNTDIPIQKTHEYREVIYMSPGETKELILPDIMVQGAATHFSLYHYQRWYDYSTDKISSHIEVVDEDKDNNRGGCGYKFQNGLVGGTFLLNRWSGNAFDQGLYRVKFTMPDNNTTSDVYYIACDASNYSDVTLPTGDATTMEEPTLSQRAIFEIRPASSLQLNNTWFQDDTIHFPTKSVGKTDEQVALAMAAQNYIVSNNTDNITCSISYPTETTGFLTLSDDSKTLSGNTRKISFAYNNKNNESATGPKDGDIAYIEVTKKDYKIARFTLIFDANTEALTQEEINNVEENGDNYFRTNEYMDANYTLLTKLDLDYTNVTTDNSGFYPYPINWNYGSYAFYTKANSSEVKYTDNPQWGEYAITNKFPFRENLGAKPLSEGGYHLYVDANEFPGTVCTVPFREDLCPGASLYVTYWMMSTANNYAQCDASVILVLKGIAKDGTETVIHRQASGQIPYNRNDKITSGTYSGAPLWNQLYFTFVNGASSTTYDHYELEIQSNNANTNGADFIIDDIRVYMKKPTASVTQQKLTCGERTRLRMDLSWNALISRLGLENDTTTVTNKSNAIDFCFIDSLRFEEEMATDPENLSDAIEKSVIHIGNEETYDNWYGTLYYDLKFDKNKQYKTFSLEEEAEAEDPFSYGSLASNNRINGTDEPAKYGFYYSFDDADEKQLSVDFFANMVHGRRYMILVKDHDDKASEVSYDSFGNPHDDPCAIVSPFEVEGQNVIRMNGEINEIYPEFCTGQIYTFDVAMRYYTDAGEERTYNGDEIYYDWFFGIMDEFNGTTDEDISNATPTTSLREALQILRTHDKKASMEQTTDQAGTTRWTLSLSEGLSEEAKAAIEKVRDVIETYLNEEPVDGLHPKLVLHRQELEIRMLANGLDLVVAPIEPATPIMVDGQPVRLCFEPMDLHLDASEYAPELQPGFEYVKYEQDGYNPAMRIGLQQIKDASETGTTISVNVRNAKFALTGVEGIGDSYKPDHIGLLFDHEADTPAANDNNNLYLTGTNDPQYASLFHDSENEEENHRMRDYVIGTVESLEAKPYEEGESSIDADSNVMKIRFSYGKAMTSETDAPKFEPREGYWYRFMLDFEEHSADESHDATQGTCQGNMIITMKVVPEYLVWQGTSNTQNWNNDALWKRATATQLKKDDDTYDYNDGEEQGYPGYVPMLFSKVIMPENGKVELYEAGFTGSSTTYQDMSWTTTIDDLEQDMENPSLDPEDGHPIQYDMMVYTEYNDDGTIKSMSTKPYRVNLCEQVHFEPNAEMLHAELLKYEKAWVDYKLESNQWHTLASPLQGVVAGDFYTDKEGTVAGTENQEYFTDITFDGKIDGKPSDANNATIENSRFSPSVYQRGWGKKAEMITVGDNGTTSNTVAVQGNWSAVYNDVKEAYTPGTGFSLKVLDMPDSKTEAIFRLPKADGSYFYYDATTGNASGDAVSINRNGEDNTDTFVSGQLITNSLKPEGTESSTKEIKVTLTQNGTNSYYLVGNPFMANLNMKQFFTTNTNLEKKYWIVTENNQEVAVGDANGLISTGTGIIAPLQSFFVQKATGATSNEVKFTAEMQTLESSTDGTSGNALYLTATTADGKKSRAAIAYDATAAATYAADEDAELFLDSNLSDVPAIYTVAGTMATSINRTSELYNIPVGIYGNSTEMVTLSFEGLKHFSSATLYDAEKKTETPLREGTTLTVPASTSGRYFLRAGTPTGNEVLEADDIQIYTLSGNRVMVTSSTPLKDIRVYNLSGALTKHVKAGVCSFELYLPDGIYIVTAENANGEVETEKVSVR